MLKLVKVELLDNKREASHDRLAGILIEAQLLSTTFLPGKKALVANREHLSSFNTVPILRKATTIGNNCAGMTNFKS
jgi:hypothetical protein